MKKTGTLVLCTVLSLASTAAFAEADAAAVRKFNAKCGSCHGKDGKGATKKGEQMGISDMTTAAWQKEFTDAKIKEALKNGVKREKDGKKQEMDALGAEMSEEDMTALISVIRGFKK